MKKTITLLLITLIAIGSISAQITVKATSGVSYTVLTQAQVNTAIANAIAVQAKIQAQTDAGILSRLAIVEKGDTIFYDKRYFTVSGSNVIFNIDSASKYLKVTVPTVDLSSINNNLTTLNKTTNDLSSRVALVEIRTTQLENWRVLTQADIDALKLYMNKLKGLTLSNTLPQ